MSDPIDRYRIIETDNFGGDYPDENFVNLPLFLSREAAQDVADAINAHFCRHGVAPRYWRVVDEDYELAPAFQP